MKLLKILFFVSMAFLIISPLYAGGDFDWVKDFNIKAEADPSGLKVRLGARFKIGDAEIDAVLSTVENPSDAYIVLRLGQMSNQPTSRVIDKYKAGKGKGWGNLAKSLGIKPGSKEFKALKSGNDLYDENPKSKGKAKGKNKKKGKKK